VIVVARIEKSLVHKLKTSPALADFIQLLEIELAVLREDYEEGLVNEFTRGKLQAYKQLLIRLKL
jgi:hypothetical protein